MIAKAKINSNLDLDVAVRKVINDHVSVTASGRLELAKGSDLITFN